MRTTLWVGKMRLKEYFLSQGPDLTAPLPDSLNVCTGNFIPQDNEK